MRTATITEVHSPSSLRNADTKDVRFKDYQTESHTEALIERWQTGFEISTACVPRSRRLSRRCTTQPVSLSGNKRDVQSISRVRLEKGETSWIATAALYFVRDFDSPVSSLLTLAASGMIVGLNFARSGSGFRNGHRSMHMLCRLSL